MSAPDKIWAWERHKTRIDGSSAVRGIERGWAEEILPEVAASMNAVEYTRADLTPPTADYVAGLEKAIKAARHSFVEFNGYDTASVMVEGLDRALAARPASPNTRVVTVAQLTAFEDALKYWNVGSADREIANIRAIIDGGQDRG